MLSKKNRLTKREDFSLAFTKGSYVSVYSGFSIKFIPNQLNATRIGFPVGKNFSKKAVVRNRARRILRAATASLITKLKPGFDIVVMIRPDCKELEFNNVISELNKVFTKANLLI